MKEPTDTARFRVSRNAIAIGSGVVGAIGTSGNRWGTDDYEARRPKNYERAMHLASTASQAVRGRPSSKPSEETERALIRLELTVSPSQQIADI